MANSAIALTRYASGAKSVLRAAHSMASGVKNTKRFGNVFEP